MDLLRVPRAQEARQRVPERNQPRAGPRSTKNSWSPGHPQWLAMWVTVGKGQTDRHSKLPGSQAGMV